MADRRFRGEAEEHGPAPSIASVVHDPDSDIGSLRYPLAIRRQFDIL
jgi:hypothetical protein